MRPNSSRPPKSLLRLNNSPRGRCASTPRAISTYAPIIAEYLKCYPEANVDSGTSEVDLAIEEHALAPDELGARQSAVHPPSTRSDVPVTMPDASEAR